MNREFLKFRVGAIFMPKLLTCLFNPWAKALPKTAAVEGRQAHYASLQKEARGQKMKKQLGGTLRP